MTISATEVGQRIAAARDRAGLTQATLAAAASMDRSAVAKIETGSRGVSALELAAFAEALSVRMEWFLQPAPAALVSHRTRNPDATTTSIDEYLERLARDVEFVAELDDTLLSRVLDPVRQPDSVREAEALAEELRAAMGFDDATPIHDLVGALSSIGLLAFSTPLGEDTADAATILLERGAVSVINSSGKLGRRRLALAHEAGHYVLADDFTIDWRVEERNESRAETLIERFARALLLPAAGLQRAWVDFREYGDVRTSAIQAASYFRVDMATLATRLSELDLVAQPDSNAIRGVRTTKADIVELDLYVPFDLEGTSLPRSYQRSILHLFRSELLTTERTLDLLLGTFDETGLPDLPPVSSQEIWQFTS